MITSSSQFIKCIKFVQQPPDSDTLPCCHAYVKSDPPQKKKKTQTLTSRAIRRHTGSVGESAGRNETVNSFPPGSAALHKASSVGLCRETGADKVHVVRDYLRVHQFARSESRPRRRSPLVHLWSRQYEFSVAFLFWKTLKKSFIFIYLSVFFYYLLLIIQKWQQ